jgi:hypothetical protein
MNKDQAPMKDNPALRQHGFESAAKAREAAERLGLFKPRPPRVPLRMKQAGYQRAYRERKRLAAERQKAQAGRQKA